MFKCLFDCIVLLCWVEELFIDWYVTKEILREWKMI